MDLLTKHVVTTVAGKTALFLKNWARLTQDPWVVLGYQIPLEYQPDKHWSTITVREQQQFVQQEKVAKLRKKGAVHTVQQTEAHIVS